MKTLLMLLISVASVNAQSLTGNIMAVSIGSTTLGFGVPTVIYSAIEHHHNPTSGTTTRLAMGSVAVAVGIGGAVAGSLGIRKRMKWGSVHANANGIGVTFDL